MRLQNCYNVFKEKNYLFLYLDNFHISIILSEIKNKFFLYLSQHDFGAIIIYLYLDKLCFSIDYIIYIGTRI